MGLGKNCDLRFILLPCLIPVLFLSVLVFLATSSYVFSDDRRHLISSVKLYQPSFIYAYLALFMQAGVVQVRN